LLVVVGSQHDQAAQELVAAWTTHCAALLTCEDLSTAGWQLRVPGRSRSQAVVSGKIISEEDIQGVVMRRPWIIEGELTHITASDREYVAAEMNAFLLAWLTSLKCPVLNRPSGTSLCGPNWRAFQWAQAAAAAGFKVQPAKWRVPPPRTNCSKHSEEPSPLIDVTVIGKRCIGEVELQCQEAARRLSQRANTILLGVRLRRTDDGPVFASATATPDLKGEEIANAVVNYMLANRAKSGSA